VKQPAVYILASKPYGTLYVGVTSETDEEMESRVEARADRKGESAVDGFVRAAFLKQNLGPRFRGDDIKGANLGPRFRGDDGGRQS
jgi:hypothetical protein